MREPAAITAHLAVVFDEHYPTWALGGRDGLGTIGLGTPSTEQRTNDPAGCIAWAKRWRDYAGPGTVRWQRKKFPTGLVELPTHLRLSGPADAASVSPAAAATWRRCGDRLQTLDAAFAAAQFTPRNIRQITELADLDYLRLRDAARWLIANPASGLLPRQLPVEGMSSKWIETHLSLVGAMVGRADLPQNDDPGTTVNLLRQLGLRTLPKLIPVHVLDSDLRAMLGGMRHLQAPVDDLNRWPQTPEIVLIAENKQTAYALDGEDLPRTVVVHAMGLHTDLYPQIRWIKEAKHVIYWGDLDTHGLEFLDKLRGLGINAQSILTDTATMNRFRHLASTSGTPKPRPVPNLTVSEAALYATLVEHFATSSEGLVLEQERIPWSHARAVIGEAIRE
jgi:hypothetical protein